MFWWLRRILRVYEPHSTTNDLRCVLRFTFLPGALRDRRPPVAPSFAARRKIDEKGVPKGSKAALWNLAFYTGVWRGDVRASYVCARVQLTRFRPVRGVLRTASTDSCVLHHVQQVHNVYRITGVLRSRQSCGCAELDSPPSLRASAHTGVAIRIPHRTHNSVA